MTKVTVRRFREGDEERTLQFLKTVFGGWRSHCQWNWKFRDVEKALGYQSIIWVMEAEGNIVGHLAAIPMKLRIGSEVFPVCQLVDGASSPKYRHRGLYKNLFQGLLNDVAEKGFAVTFGFPNRFFYRVCERQGSFQNICQIKKMFKMLSLNNALNTLRIQPSFANSAETAQDSSLKEFLAVQRGKAFFMFLDVVRKILSSTVTSIFGSKNKADKTELKEIEPENLGTEFDALWVKFSKDYKFAFERDQEFLNWRYSDPEAEYRAYIVTREKKVVGYVVTSLEEKSLTVGRLRFSCLKMGHIVDLVAEKALVVPLISAAEDELKKQGAFIAECWAADGSFSFETLRTGRYCQLPDEMYKVYFVASVHAPQLKTSISPEYSKEILLSPGDSDIV